MVSIIRYSRGLLKPNTRLRLIGQWAQDAASVLGSASFAVLTGG